MRRPAAERDLRERLGSPPGIAPPPPATGTLRRLTATALDLAVIAGWAAFAAVVGLVARSSGLDFGSPHVTDVFAFATLVAPATLTFAWQESSTRQATFGKRRTGLRVVDRAGRRLTRRRSLARSVVKFLPWQLAHTAVFALIADPKSTGMVALSITAQVVVVASVLAMSLDRQHRALHDWGAGTRVVEGSRP
jgi:uncharacterized RDD family membrane protein YckC